MRVASQDSLTPRPLRIARATTASARSEKRAPGILPDLECGLAQFSGERLTQFRRFTRVAKPFAPPRHRPKEGHSTQTQLVAYHLTICAHGKLAAALHAAQERALS